MTPERARELLGGLASGILTPEERQSLFEAALNDQALFNEVAGELELATFLQSPDTRAQLANRIEVEAPRRSWWTVHPAWVALTGVFAACVVMYVAVWPPHAGQMKPPESVTEPALPAPAVPAPAVPVAGNRAVENKPEANQPASATTLVRPQSLPKPMSPAAGPASSSAQLQDRLKREEALAPAKDKAADNLLAEKKDAEKPRVTLRDDVAPATPPPPPAPAQPEAFGRNNAIEARRSAAPAPVPPMVIMSERGRGQALLPAATGSLNGSVHDAAGAQVGGATIEVVNKESGAKASIASDPSGQFAVDSLPPGAYNVRTQAPGFRVDARDITVNANQPAKVDIPLQVGAVSSTVLVETAPVSNLQVAVLDFTSGSSRSGQQAAEILARQIEESSHVQVIDRTLVQQSQQSAQQKQQFGQQKKQPQQVAGAGVRQSVQNTSLNSPSPQEAAAIGRSVGADAVIVGSVQPASPGGKGGLARAKDAKDADTSNVAVTAQVYDTRHGQPLTQATANATSLEVAVNKVGLALASQLALEGSVTKVDRDTATVNFSAPNEPHTGTRLSIYRNKRRIGELTLTSVSGQTAEGRFTGGKPRQGDRVTNAR